MSDPTKILVIDDDEIMLGVIEDLLIVRGYSVVTRSTPIGVTQTIVQEGVHLVVVDLRMPLMQGDRLVSLLRSWERVRDLPVILISGATREGLEEVAKGLEGASVITKDNLDATLPAAIHRALRRGSSVPSTLPLTYAGAASEVEGFNARLSKRIREAEAIWQAVANGERRYRELEYLVDTIHGQAQLLGLSQMAGLLSEIHAITHKVASGATPTKLAVNAVMRALRVASTMPKLHSEGTPVDAGPIMGSLRRANELMGA